MPKVKEHLRSLPYKEVPAALDAISMTESATASKLCLRFAILTAARPGESRGASWEDIDLAASLWVIPAERMKAEREHRVPLSDSSPLSYSRKQNRLSDGSSLIFPSPVNRGKPVSENTLGKVLKSAGAAQQDHGARLSLVIQNMGAGKHQTQAMPQWNWHWRTRSGAQSSRRTCARTWLEQRRTLMQQWANFVSQDVHHEENSPEFRHMLTGMMKRMTVEYAGK